MKLTTVRTVYICLLIAGLLLWIPSKLLASPVFSVAALVCLLAAIAILLIFWRCPSCRRYLGRQLWSRYCRHCGEELDFYL